jgi:phosphoglycolate phosphatase-like HAD superfamily hydrolase
MNNPRVRAVLFDWDGTLADTAEPAYRCYVRMFADFGIPFDREIYVCGDDGPRRKPDPEALRVCLDRLGVAPEDAAYVGDSAEDVMMARAARVFSKRCSIFCDD